MNAVSAGTSIRSSSFWTQVEPGQHVVQCYSHDDGMIDALEGFVSTGLRAGEGVAVIGTATHVHELEKRLRAHWLDVDRARWEGRYVPMLAQETLTRFMADDGLPDEDLFRETVDTFFRDGPKRRMRFFGEMVAVLWAQGNAAGAIALEALWSRYMHTREMMTLFCAYDRSLFQGYPAGTMKGVCDMHTLTLPG